MRQLSGQCRLCFSLTGSRSRGREAELARDITDVVAPAKAGPRATTESPAVWIPAFARFPVCAVQSLTIDGIVIPPAPPLVPSTGLTAGYVFSPTQLAIRGYYFTRRVQNVVITYSAGFAETPPDIAQACIELVALRYRERTRIGEISKSVGSGETVTYAQKDMSLPITTLLQQYRLITPITSYSVIMARPIPTRRSLWQPCDLGRTPRRRAGARSVACPARRGQCGARASNF